jgi:hypothetical protein
MAQGISAQAAAPSPAPNPKAVLQAMPQGVPFASMDRSAKQLDPPPASMPMAVDPARVAQSMQRLQGQVDSRLDGTQLGSGNLSAPDMGPIQGELAQMAEEQRQIRILSLKQQHADVAFKLWTTLYDPRKEEDERRKAAAAAGTVTRAAAAAAAPASPSAAEAAPAAAPAQPAAAVAPVPQPLPKVVSIGGTLGAYRAELLVPYVGEVDATVGTRLPAGRRVSRVGPEGVFVRDARLGEVELGFGDSVPLVPPSEDAAVAPKIPDIRPPTPLVPPPPQGYVPAQQAVP